MKDILKIGKDSYGNLISIDQVKNGLECNCDCVDCGQRLVAKNQGQKRAAHFSHYNSNCSGNLETYLHKIAKEIISKETQINLPQFGRINYSDCRIEKQIETIRPDIIIKSENDLIIEILVRHPTGDEKINIIKRLGIEAFEIDLSKLNYESDLLTIKEFVLDKITNKKVLFLKKEKQEESNILWKILAGVGIFLLLKSVFSKFFKNKIS